MPTKVWKCDFCSHTERLGLQSILKHETDCSFNPVNKNCFSCLHHGYIYDAPHCDVGVEGEALFNIHYESEPCDLWKFKD